MSSYTSYGTSPAIVITAEDLQMHYYNKQTKVDMEIKPPLAGLGQAITYATEKWSNPWQDWSFSKLTEPKFDGIADKIGVISNQPDLIQDAHIISLMRLVSKYNSPEYRAVINTTTTTPGVRGGSAPPKNKD